MAAGSGISVTDLARAASKGNYQEVLRNLNEDVNPNTNCFDKSGCPFFPALHACILHFEDDERTVEKTRVLQLLIERGADVDAIKCGTRPLHLAAALSTDAVAQLLLDAGADPQLEDNKERTPAQIAKSLENEATRRLLVIADLKVRVNGLEEELISALAEIDKFRNPSSLTGLGDAKDKDECVIC